MEIETYIAYDHSCLFDFKNLPGEPFAFGECLALDEYYALRFGFDRSLLKIVISGDHYICNAKMLVDKFRFIDDFKPVFAASKLVSTPDLDDASVLWIDYGELESRLAASGLPMAALNIPTRLLIETMRNMARRLGNSMVRLVLRIRNPDELGKGV